MIIRKASCYVFMLACLATGSLSAEVLCGPGGGEHDVQKYKGQVPKDYQVYGLLDTLNWFDASVNNKYLEKRFEGVKEKARSVQDWYAKRGITIPEAECVLGQQGQKVIDGLLAKQGAQTQKMNLAEAEAEEPKYRRWLNSSFPSRDAMVSECIPDRANTEKELSDAHACLNGLARQANKEFRDYQDPHSRSFILTDRRKREINSAASSFSNNFDQLRNLVSERIENWEPPAIAERCFDDICLGDPISIHADKLVPIDRKHLDQQADFVKRLTPGLDNILTSSDVLSEAEMLQMLSYQAFRGGVIDRRGLNLMLREETPLCDGKTYSGSIEDGDKVTYVTVGALNNQAGEPIIGIRSLWRNLYDVPRTGPGFDQFEAAIQKRYSDDSMDRFDDTSSITINRNMGPFVQLKFGLSSVNYDHYVEPAKSSFCGQPKELTW